jgi:hypothetical protein
MKGEFAMNCSVRYFLVAFLTMIAVISTGARRNSAQNMPPSQGSASGESEEKAHMDHKAKHGGTFFMCLDNSHHLEGVLLPPGTFRVYLYDDHTKPLKAEQVRETSGTIQIGDSEDAPKIALGPGKKKEALEAALGSEIKFPVPITLLLHLPGMAPDEKPELYNFTFTQFTDEHGPGTSAPMGKMPGMK